MKKIAVKHGNVSLHYWVDDNMNTWDASYQEDVALAHSETLTDCRFCFNCHDCIRCSYCHDCSDCVDLYSCSDCIYCKECSNCVHCIRCSACALCCECSVCVKLERCFKCFNTGDGIRKLYDLRLVEARYESSVLSFEVAGRHYELDSYGKLSGAASQGCAGKTYRGIAGAFVLALKKAARIHGEGNK